MVPLRRRLLALALGGALASSSPAAEFMVPPIDGEMSGEFTALKFPGAPKLHWTLKAHGTASGGREVEIAIRGTGTRLAVRGALDPAGNGTWTIADGTLETRQWLPAAAPEIGPAADGVVASGEIVLSGGGEIKAGQLTGAVRLTWRDGTLKHEGQGWTLEGVSFDGEFAIDSASATVASVRPFELTVRTISTERFGARNLVIGGSLKADLTLALSESRVEVAGGEVTVDATTVPLSPLAADLQLRVTNVGLQDVAALVPAGLSESRGRINGGVRIGWSEADGFKLGEGNLVLGSTEPATVRLASSPGFLTGRVPEKISLLPEKLGALSRWLSLTNPAYGDIREIELGRTELRVENLSIQLTPDGDREGRTARVQLTARPAGGGVVESLKIDINVSGPLSEVLRMGMAQGFSVELK